MAENGARLVERTVVLKFIAPAVEDKDVNGTDAGVALNEFITYYSHDASNHVTVTNREITGKEYNDKIDACASRFVVYGLLNGLLSV